MTTTESSNNTNIISFASSEISLSRTARYWILLLFDIPSTVCALFVLFCILIDQKLRSSVKNHILTVLLILGLASQLIDVPLYLNFIVHSRVVPSITSTCIIWWFVDIGIYNGGTIIMVWVSIERHIIIFHDQLISTRKRRIFIHYLPILIMLLYIFIYYTYAICYFPCENAYDYTLPYCSVSPCYQNDPIMGLWDWIVNTAAPAFLEPVFSIAFVLRVVWHKYHSHLPMQWRKQRKMAIQLMSLSALNLISNFPLGIIGMAHLFGLSEDLGVDAQQYFFFLCYFVIFLFPFICLASISGVYRKFRRSIFHGGQHRQFRGLTVTVRPIDFPMNTTIHN